MHAERVKRLWERNPTYKRHAHRDVLLIRQYSLLLAVLLISVVYRVLAVLVVQTMYLLFRCESSGSTTYVITVSAENACFVSIFMWSAGASASENWTAGLANRLVLPLLQGGFLCCFCANLVHFFASAVTLPQCWPAYFTGILWGITWLNVASFVVVACLLVQLSSPMNLFMPVRQADRNSMDEPEKQEMDRA